jgi:hypothetical protein
MMEILRAHALAGRERGSGLESIRLRSHASGKADRPKQPGERLVIDDGGRRGDFNDMLQLMSDDRHKRRVGLLTVDLHVKIADVRTGRSQQRSSRQRSALEAVACQMHEHIGLLDSFDKRSERRRTLDAGFDHRRQ